MKHRPFLCVLVPLCLFVSIAQAHAQNLQDVLKRGEVVFTQSCTGYCHAPKGGGGAGAPRLAARGFDQTTINNIVMRGVSGTPMSGFATILPRTDLTAVVAYVAALNGIPNPAIAPAAVPAGPGPTAPADRVLPAEAARGRDLFYEAARGFGRCSTCHEVNGLGIPVSSPIAQPPASVQSLKTLMTPLVSTAVINGESMPALVLNKGARSVVFYDLTAAPPVLVTAEPSAVKISDGSSWRHASVIASYTDGELESILTFLRNVR